MGEKKIAAYKIISDAGGNRYRFYCELSGALACITDPIRAETPEKELQLAWETAGRSHFNRCHKCGRWVIDEVYNAEVCECVKCAPYEVEPKYCKTCGVRIETPSRKCPSCGNKLLYEGDDEAV